MARLGHTVRVSAGNAYGAGERRGWDTLCACGRVVQVATEVDFRLGTVRKRGRLTRMRRGDAGADEADAHEDVGLLLQGGGNRRG